MMADLYTSQVHLKQLLHGQATAAFTRASDDVLKLLDPAFTIDERGGTGGLAEDDHGRLRCPVRDCGEWHLFVQKHIARCHPTIGVDGIKGALGIPKSTPLLSVRGREQWRSIHPRSAVMGRRPAGEIAKAVSARKTAATSSTWAHVSMSQRNFADTCPAQLSARITRLAVELGHSPSKREFAAKHGRAIEGQIDVVFGSWNAAKAMCGLSIVAQHSTDQRVSQSLVCESLRAWVDAHGDLPSISEVQSPERTPRLPDYRTIMRALGVNNWAAAMRSAIEHLGITSERYGAPSRRSA